MKTLRKFVIEALPRAEGAPDVKISKESFPAPTDLFWYQWPPLWAAHGIEVRGRPLNIEPHRYRQIEIDGRLVWIVARDDAGDPIGYSCHWVYRDMAFGDTVGSDGIWYVKPEWRAKGIGVHLKKIGLQEVWDKGAVASYDLIRRHGPDTVLLKLGYQVWGTRWGILRPDGEGDAGRVA